MNAPVQNTPQGTATEAPANLPVVTPTRRQEVRVVTDPIPVLDTARFEHMQRIATVMAASNLIPDGLCMIGDKDHKELLPVAQVTANCFLVVNQAVRWGMDPFAVAQCVSVVHGKLCYEGKLIAAVLEAKLGLNLEYEITGQGDAMKVVVSAAIDGEPVLDSKGKPKTVEGTVADWKTTGAGSPWAARGGFPRMLRYRGAREWSRVHAPGLMLGVYSEDEMDALSDDRRATRARDVTPRDDGPPSPPSERVSLPPQSRGDADLALAEAGRDDGQQVTWSDPADTAAASTAPSADDGGIPPQYRRYDQAAEKEWLNELGGAFSGCEDLETFAAKQREVMAPRKGKISPDAWTAAQRLAEDTFHRLSRDT